MAKGYKIFPRSQAFRDNFDRIFRKPEWNPTPAQAEFLNQDVPAKLYGGCRVGMTKSGISIGIFKQ